jgi:hypothetical protein
MLFPVILIVLLTYFLCRHDELLSSENRPCCNLGRLCTYLLPFFFGLLLLLFLKRSE